MPAQPIIVEGSLKSRGLSGFGDDLTPYTYNPPPVGSGVTITPEEQLRVNQENAASANTGGLNIGGILGDMLKSVMGAVQGNPNQAQANAAQAAAAATAAQHDTIWGLPKPVVYGVGGLAVVGIGFMLWKKR